jgi:hypothetical protein
VAFPIDMLCGTTSENFVSQTLMGMEKGNIIMFLEKTLLDIQKKITKYHEIFIIVDTFSLRKIIIEKCMSGMISIMIVMASI